MRGGSRHQSEGNPSSDWSGGVPQCPAVDLLPRWKSSRRWNRLGFSSRLADALARAELDVALVPSIEYFRIPGSVILSDVCIACEGAVKSVKLFGRTPIGEMKTLALDEGSRTSAALTRIYSRSGSSWSRDWNDCRRGSRS